MVFLTRSFRLLLHASLLLALSVPLAGALGLPSLDAKLEVTGAAHVDVEANAALPVAPLFDQATIQTPLAGTRIIDAVGPSFALPGGREGDQDAATFTAVPAIVPAPGATASAAAGVTLLWILVERLGAGRVLLGLYSRLAPSQLLEHERREKLLALVRDRPGIGPQDIAQALGTGWGVTIHHLNKMERAGLITSQRAGQMRCYFAAGAVGREEQKAASMFRAASTRRIAEFIAQKPGLTQTQIAQELGFSASALSKQVARLEAAALLRREAADGAPRLYPQPALTGALT